MNMISSRCVAALLAAHVLASGAQAGLSASAAQDAIEAAWSDYATAYATETEDELAAGEIISGDAVLRFKALSFEDGVGEECTAPCAAADGRTRPLFISMHGGGNAAPEENDEQWENQIKLGHDYAPREGIYIAPRAPTNEWNCWHGPDVDPLLARLIRALVAAGTVDPDQVYLMGYSAGGDGVYALAPRMAYRFAAAAMMAGHPNGVSMESLRNLPFAIHVGADDDAYDRAGVAREYGEKLDALQAADPDGYAHQVQVHEGKGHWMDLDDRVAVPWMEQFARDPFPEKIVWRLSGQHHGSFYWIALPEGGKDGDLITAEREGQTVTLDGPSGRVIAVRLSDEMLDMDQDVVIRASDGTELFSGGVARSQAAIEASISALGDEAAITMAEVIVTLP